MANRSGCVEFGMQPRRYGQALLDPGDDDCRSTARVSRPSRCIDEGSLNPHRGKAASRMTVFEPEPTRHVHLHARLGARDPAPFGHDNMDRLGFEACEAELVSGSKTSESGGRSSVEDRDPPALAGGERAAVEDDGAAPERCPTARTQSPLDMVVVPPVAAKLGAGHNTVLAVGEFAERVDARTGHCSRHRHELCPNSPA